MRIIEGNLVAQGLKVGIVVGRFNEFIVSKLLGGALDGLKRHGVEENNIDVAWAPGAFEIPLVAKKMAKNDNVSASRSGLGCLEANKRVKRPLLLGLREAEECAINLPNVPPDGCSLYAIPSV